MIIQIIEDHKRKIIYDYNLAIIIFVAVDPRDGSVMCCPIKARLLEGAPLNMNEFLFFHRPSSTLIGYILNPDCATT